MPTAVDELVRVDPATLVIGPNVRSDTHPDAKEFAASVKARGVLEVITAYRDDTDAGLVVLRGQRRALVAAEVGTPTGTVTVRVVPAPEDADRIIDQMGENLHRAAMREREVRDGIEQLSLCGVSAAQIAKRTAIKRAVVNAALTVAGSEATRARMDDDGLTLEQAAVFAEFEDDDQAVKALTDALRFGRSLDHVAQRLRDAAAEAAVVAVEVERLRGEGLPVLGACETPSDLWRVRLDNLRDADGQPVPKDEWPQVPGAVLAVTRTWTYPTRGQDQDSDDGQNTDHLQGEGDVQDDGEDLDDSEDEDDAPAAVKALVPVWVCLDPAAAGLRHIYDSTSRSGTAAAAAPDEATREAERTQRRVVRENNAAWRSAETVRRKWLAGFLKRKSAPQGAEALICQAVLAGEHSLVKAAQDGHPMLAQLLGVEAPKGYYGTRAACASLAATTSAPKGSTMLTLASVIAAWERCADVHTWRSPGPWDARVMGALVTWGYSPSDVESLLTASTEADLVGEPADDESAAEVDVDQPAA